MSDQDRPSEANEATTLTYEQGFDHGYEACKAEHASRTTDRDYNFMRDLAIGSEELLNEYLAKQKPLSDEEILKLAVEDECFEWHESKHGDKVYKTLIAPAINEIFGGWFGVEEEVKKLARAIEKAHGIGVDHEG